MKFSYSWLKEIVGFKEMPQELAEFLNMRAFEIESVYPVRNKPLQAAAAAPPAKRISNGVDKKDNDWALDIKLPANRYADAAGHIGVANEIGTLLSAKRKAQSAKPQLKAQKLHKNLLNIVIENADNCPRYTAIVMENVKVSESPEWMRRRLETCGLQSINNLVDAANYVMLETGQPLHIFDFEKIKDVEIPNPKSQIPNKSQIQNSKFKTILVRRAKKGEKISALDDKTYELDPDVLVIADGEKPIAIAGIKGGRESGVSAETKTIILEAANFAPTVIRHGSQKLGFKTDASIRFEHGLDPNQTEAALERLAALIRDIAGGDALQKADKYPKPVKPHTVLFRPDYANRLLGVKLTFPQYQNFLVRLGFGFKKREDGFLAEIPTNRPDLTIEEDLIEEAGRLYGYENIPAAMPETVLAPPPANDELFWENRVKEILAASGFTESLFYEFTGDKELDKFFARRDNLLLLENPTSPETAYLVPRILYKYLISGAENLRNFEQVKIFGIGKSFTKNQESRIKNQGMTERKDLIIVTAKKGATGEEEFYQLKGTIDELLEALGIGDHWYDDVVDRKRTPRDKFHPYRFAEIKIGEEKIGNIGEIHPAVLDNLKSKARIAAAEINFEKLRRAARTETEFRPLARFPSVVRDIAVLVPEETRTVEVENVIQTAGGKLLADTDLFDYFRDEQRRREGQKSIAFHLIFQSPERTLRDEEVDKLLRKIIAALQENGWEVRK